MPVSFETLRPSQFDPIVQAWIAGRSLRQRDRSLDDEVARGQEYIAASKQRRELEARAAQTEQQAAEGIAQFQMNQMPRDERRQVLGQQPRDAADAARLGAAAGRVQSDADAEQADVKHVLENITKTPEAKVAFLQFHKQDRQERLLKDTSLALSGRIQDKLIAAQQSPGWAPFADRLGPMADELAQVEDPNVDPRLRAQIIDKVTHEFDQLSALAYQHGKRVEDDQLAIQQIAETEAGLPPGHPFRTQLQLLRMAVQNMDVKGADALRMLKFHDLGLQEIEPGVWVDPAKYAGVQQRAQAQQENAGIKRERNAVLERQGEQKLKQEADRTQMQRERNQVLNEQGAQRADQAERRLQAQIDRWKKEPGGMTTQRRLSLVPRMMEAAVLNGQDMTEEQALQKIRELEAKDAGAQTPKANVDEVMQFFQDELKKP